MTTVLLLRLVRGALRSGVVFPWSKLSNRAVFASCYAVGIRGAMCAGVFPPPSQSACEQYNNIQTISAPDLPSPASSSQLEVSQSPVASYRAPVSVSRS